jgi:hypothetical protein
MDLSPDDIEALKSIGRYRLNRGTAEFFAVKKDGNYDFANPGRIPGLSPAVLDRLIASDLVEVSVQGNGGDLVTLTHEGERVVDGFLADEV